MTVHCRRLLRVQVADDFAPTAPAGSESNWIETVPGKGFYPFFRFYGPKEGVFDGTWKLPDVELVK